MRLPDTAHTSRPWRIHSIARDFKLEDVWELSTPGRAHELHVLVRGLAAADPAKTPSRATRALWSLRWRIGDRLGWDDPVSGPDSRAPTLRDRLPEDLRDSPGPEFEALPFTSLYLTEEEFAAEVANRTMHGVMHIGWIREESGGYHGQMAVLVKPRGRLGSAYMAAIRPARHLVVYPQTLRAVERRWHER